ncbi:hypothetical protein WMF18_38775 [Sorangium sp. So ce315]|uniref:hypothetical protein n=1 Tax=Sorangium sp. So ce315 TaxID=3133299 RepID=UPI003F5DA366
MAFSRLTRCIGVAACGVALVACGDPDAGGPPGGGAGGGGGGPAGALPDAPVLAFVMPMTGVLHVEWTPQDGCDAFEGERKDPMNDYAVAFTVAGTKKSYMDPEATEDMEYTYRLRCKVGEIYSEYSNEMSGNPTDEE